MYKIDVWEKGQPSKTLFESSLKYAFKLFNEQQSELVVLSKGREIIQMKTLSTHLVRLWAIVEDGVVINQFLEQEKHKAHAALKEYQLYERNVRLLFWEGNLNQLKKNKWRV